MAFILLVLRGLSAIVVVDAIASWFLPPDKFPRRVTTRLLEPLYRPLRAVLPPERMGGLDLTPLILIFGIQAVAGLLGRF